MKAILGSVERDVADAFAYIPYGLAAAVVFLLIMILYNRKKYGRVSFIIKSSLMIIYVVVVGQSDIVFAGIRNCRPGGSDFFQSSGGIFGLCDPVDRKCIIVFAGRDFMSLDVEADAELEAQLPAWIRRESADRDAADADGKRPVSAG